MAASERTCLVTGATGALGKATALALAKTGATVLLVARDADRGERAAEEVRTAARNPSVRVLVADLSLMDSARGVARQASELAPRLNVLVNCAAVFRRDRTLTTEGLELMFATNAMGPFVLTNGLLPALRAGAPSRVLTVTAPSTSELDFGDLQGANRFRSLHAFGATKTANLLFTYELARRLDGTGVTANAVHPGLIKSGLMREAPAPIRLLAGAASHPPAKAADALARLSTSEEFAGLTGRFYKQTTLSESSEYSRDPGHQKEFWNAASRLAGLS